MSSDQPISLPADAVLAVVEGQRNSAHTELAKAQVLINQLAAERDEARAEVERVRGAPDA
ncbi:hypothetical protein ACGFNP_25185 [Nonomuraea sp. NPDC049269]|uniref:hypothetical protein n=1 Tax=Nonomuraea sp. NPDC049269 TaxID=3364349 RepID=UPI003724388E